MSRTLRDLLAATTPRVAEGRFVVASVPASLAADARRLLADVHAPFSLTEHGAEVSLMVREEEWDRLAPRLRGSAVERGFRLVTLDLELEWTVVGYLAAVTETLAREQIPVGVLSTFHRDHLLVREGDLERAMGAIRRLIGEAQLPGLRVE